MKRKKPNLERMVAMQVLLVMLGKKKKNNNQTQKFRRKKTSRWLKPYMACKCKVRAQLSSMFPKIQELP